MQLRTYIAFLFTIAISFAANAQRDNESCGIILGKPLTNAYGPYDFRDPNYASNVNLVVGAHFKKNIEQLKSNKAGTGTAHADLDYTLRALPNHHRALYAIAKLERQDRAKVAADGIFRRTEIYTAECYFKRAIYFRPQDPIPHMLFGMHLHLVGKLAEAEINYLNALNIDPNNPEILYNIGLLYVDLGDIDNAKKYANLAYEMGFPLEGLKLKLLEMQQKK
ncbi:tetratricopeptide repeat protein [Colwellia sp. MEBiC06753]